MTNRTNDETPPFVVTGVLDREQTSFARAVVWVVMRADWETGAGWREHRFYGSDVGAALDVAEKELGKGSNELTTA